MDVDVWVRGTNHARTETLPDVPEDAASWTERDVRALLTQMLLALERVQNPGGDPPPVVLRDGFLVKDKYNNWVQKDVFYTKEEKDNSAYILGSLSVRDAPIVSIPDVPAVPEPATWAMLIMGFGGIGSVMRRQRRAALAAA